MLNCEAASLTVFTTMCPKGQQTSDDLIVEDYCSDPSYESDPSNEYSPLGLTDVMNSIFLDPSNEFLTQAVNIGIPKQTLGLAFMFQNEATK